MCSSKPNLPFFKKLYRKKVENSIFFLFLIDFANQYKENEVAELHSILTQPDIVDNN